MISQKKSLINDTEKYKEFGLVWGLMKYHHSEVSKGKYNWDEVFVKNFDKLESIDSQASLEDFFLNFIMSFKESKIQAANYDEDLFKKNWDYGWIDKYSDNNKLYTHLKQLRDNTIISDYYVSNKSLTNIPTFENEKGFKSFDYKNKSHRLLEFFSFWNVIQYHYVNKYLMDKNWFDQLEYFVDGFASNNSKFEYELLKTKLNADLNDSHTEFTSKIVFDSLFKYKAPFRVKVVADTLVINSVFNDTLGKKDDLKLGDLIIEVQKKNIRSILKQKMGPLAPSSNESFLKIFAEWGFVLRNEDDSIEVKIKRKDSVFNKHLHLYKNFKVTEQSSLKSFVVEKKWQLIDDKIGYINLKHVSKYEIQKAFEDFSDTNGIILDLRNYPKDFSVNDITKYIYPDKKKFVKVLFPKVNRPSMGKFEEPAISYIKEPFTSGSKNSKYYNKKIILLVDHTTQSRAEYMGMAIQASPNCLTVGETTAGSVMNITVFTTPDGTKTSFTSMGAFYPDGTEVQRKGLKIDYFIKENTSNFLQDQYIIKGIELIKSSKN